MSYPEKPTINGPTTGSPGKEYEYIITAKDPDDDDLYYRIVWDDDWSVSWVGPYKSGEEIILKKTFKERGQHRLDVGVKDYEEVIGEYNASCRCI